VKSIVDKIDQVLETKIRVMVPKIKFKVVKVFGKKIKVPYPTAEKKIFTPRMILNLLKKLGAVKKLLEKVRYQKKKF
jgi:predicted SAM-dependent methyltransferase